MGGGRYEKPVEHFLFGRNLYKPLHCNLIINCWSADIRFMSICSVFIDIMLNVHWWNDTQKMKQNIWIFSFYKNVRWLTQWKTGWPTGWPTGPRFMFLRSCLFQTRPNIQLHFWKLDGWIYRNLNSYPRNRNKTST